MIYISKSWATVMRIYMYILIKFHTRLKDTVNSQCLLNDYMNK